MRCSPLEGNNIDLMSLWMAAADITFRSRMLFRPFSVCWHRRPSDLNSFSLRLVGRSHRSGMYIHDQQPISRTVAIQGDKYSRRAAVKFSIRLSRESCRTTCHVGSERDQNLKQRTTTTTHGLMRSVATVKGTPLSSISPSDQNKNKTKTKHGTFARISRRGKPRIRARMSKISRGTTNPFDYRRYR